MHTTIFSLFALALTQYVAATAHDVTVGNGGLNFSPNSVTAAVGDTVVFEFYPNSHSVAQSAFSSPCQPMNPGIYSGFVPSTSGMASTVWTVTINNTNPIWLYCSQGDHCERGMAMVINPPASGNTIAAYISAASQASSTASPATINGGVFGAATSTNTSSMSSSMSGSMSGSMTSSMMGSMTGSATMASVTGSMTESMTGSATAASGTSGASGRGDWGVVGALGAGVVALGGLLV